MIIRSLICRYIFISKKLLVMSETFYSVGLEGMGFEDKNNQEISTKDKLAWKEPFGQFKSWYDEACATPGILEPRAMCLATCTRSGIPSARFVILRGYDVNGFKFYTNYSSRKGVELNENPCAALVFYWERLRRSIRIEGTVKRLSEEESTQFFHSRPKSYQIEAAFSDQSQPISSRTALGEKERKFKELHADSDFIPKPKEWGGFILKPHSFEFWQDQSDHLHDKIRFRMSQENEIVENNKGENGWIYERLQP